MVSVIIPAYNEANVIGSVIDALMPGVNAGEIELVVVCNGCSDDTPTIVKSYGHNVKCIETYVASKTNALNIGDNEAKGFPRFYLDADVILSSKSVKIIADVLLQGRYFSASPKMRMDYRNSSWLVKSYYDVWQQLSYVQEGMIGTGVFALTEAGRKRFEKFPDIIADDGFIRAMFRKQERVSVDYCYSIVRSPMNLSNLLKIKTRSRLGRYELAEKFPELLRNEEKNYGDTFFDLICNVKNWIKLPVYVYVNLVSRIRAQRYYKIKGFTGWERDTSSRQ